MEVKEKEKIRSFDCQIIFKDRKAFILWQVSIVSRQRTVGFTELSKKKIEKSGP